jgi:GNAT superfamily N-acetyltransferase
MAATIRRATPSDAPALGAIHSASWAELYPKVLPPEVLSQLNPPYMEHLWQKFVSRGSEYKQWVALIDNEIVGFVGVGPGREPGREETTELYFLYVVPAHRKSGVGTQLLAAADADYLWVWEEFKYTRKFYTAQDFIPEIVRVTRGRGPRSRVGVLFGSAYQTELRMIRRPAAA